MKVPTPRLFHSAARTARTIGHAPSLVFDSTVHVVDLLGTRAVTALMTASYPSREIPSPVASSHSPRP